jgi:hypothetical protein
MSVGIRETRPPASVPAIGPWVPTATLHVMFFAVAAGLCFLVIAPRFWLVIGLLLSAAVTLVPNWVPTWWLLLVLALSQFWREPSVTDLAFYLLLAGVHLLHALGGLARLLPWRGRMQVGALVRPLRRFVLVQAAAQGAAACTLLAFGGGPGAVRGLSILAAAALGVVTAMLARRLRPVRGRLPAAGTYSTTSGRCSTTS